MRLLLAEDNADFATGFADSVKAIDGCELAWAASRDSALAMLDEEAFDLVILDRRLPTADGVLDDHPDHGWRVYQHILDNFPGTPVWFLTGTSDADFAVEILHHHGRVADIHGRQQAEPMYRVWWKSKVTDCLKALVEFAGHRADLDRIAVRIQVPDAEISEAFARTIRLFARRRNGTAVDVTPLTGGLSSSQVLKIVVRGPNGAAQITAVAKVGVLPQVAEENRRYRDHVMPLPPGAFPQQPDLIDVSSGNFGGLFYGVVGEDIRSLFDRLAEQDAAAVAVPDALRQIQNIWHQALERKTVRIKQIRRLLIGDTDLPKIQAELDGIDIAGIENRQVVAGHCIQHGDLHCANVVFDARGVAMLIDFGDVGPSIASIDPITLELGTIFHPQRDKLPAAWPSEAAMAQWADVAAFSAGCTFSAFLTACRQWTVGVAAGQDEIMAVAYGYALRQLKYAGTDKALARTLIRACIAYFS